MNCCCNGSQRDRNRFSFDDHIANAFRVLAGEFFSQMWKMNTNQLSNGYSLAVWSLIIKIVIIVTLSFIAKYLLIRRCCLFSRFHLFINSNHNKIKFGASHSKKKKKKTQPNYEALKCAIFHYATEHVQCWSESGIFGSNQQNTFAAWFECGFAI